MVNREVFQFRALPFGLKYAPRVFTKIINAVEAFLQGPQLTQYFDDWLLHRTDQLLLIDNLSIAWQTILRLGLIPNTQKSDLVP